MSKESFKEHVCMEIIKAAKQYKKIYVDYEYLICSEAFIKKDYYIIAAEKDNFQHLTGVHSKINAQNFFNKSYEGTLSEEDFDFIKKGQDEKNVKGTVRRKIKVLPDIMTLFKEGLQTEESFKKNKVICSFAAADGNCTLGFTETEKARPKSLIKGNELRNPKPVELILRRKTGSELFSEIIVGDSVTLNKYKEHIGKIVVAYLFANKGKYAPSTPAGPTVPQGSQADTNWANDMRTIDSPYDGPSDPGMAPPPNPEDR